MSDTYTKLFASITESTIWCEPAGTRLLWITFLAKSNRHGEVFGSIPGMARLANITLAECEAGLAALLAPDPYSRTPDNEGRRIEAIDGGWRILNHAKFDRLRSEAEAKERRLEGKRSWDREHRPSGHGRTKSKETVQQQSDRSPTQSDDSPSQSAPPPTPTTSLKEQEQKLSVRPAAGRFDDWWSVYPSKVGRKKAFSIWARRKLDSIADVLIADVRNRADNDDGWLRGYVPNPTTYLNQDRWEDELRQAPQARDGPMAGVPNKSTEALMGLQGLISGNRLDPGRNCDGLSKARPALTGPDTGEQPDGWHRLRLAGSHHGGS